MKFCGGVQGGEKNKWLNFGGNWWRFVQYSERSFVVACQDLRYLYLYLSVSVRVRCRIQNWSKKVCPLVAIWIAIQPWRFVLSEYLV